ncbi:MAG: dihydroorotate dehydrogenase electron transfer subunit [Prevotella sp.]|nr:dihydroorotate dehydrogenase electron transfer subunit [Prevotella sp.]MBR0276640.1 dihydroorotate dehydrogenase electron transfer subunit [Prevotella sp.]
MKKYIMDLTVSRIERVHERYVLIRLTDDKPLPPMAPGQFAEVRVDDSPTTFLRRPISICNVDSEANELWLLVACIGDGTRRLGRLQPGSQVSCVLPLGNGWTLQGQRAPLLIGGGVGVAPLLYLGRCLKEGGVEPTFLLGARTKNDLLLIDEFRQVGRVLVTTEDGSAGERGFVTNHSVLQQEHFDLIQTCGPTPMMKAVAHYAHEKGIACEVSLENLMACGLGACLCCVEKTTEGNVCVCKEGPVFNIERLLWQN